MSYQVLRMCIERIGNPAWNAPETASHHQKLSGGILSKIRVTNGVTEKLCSSCKVWKPTTDFSPGGKSHQRASEGGVHCECRECNAARHRRRRSAA